MVEIYTNLIVCSAEDYLSLGDNDNYSVAFCAKSPFHQWLVGYKGNLDKHHPEYLIAKRPERNMIAANLVDVDRDGFVSDSIIKELINFIDEELAKHKLVLLVCNQGQSRSSSVGLMYLIHKGMFLDCNSFDEVEREYSKIQPNHHPNLGMRIYTKRFWERAVGMEERYIYG